MPVKFGKLPPVLDNIPLNESLKSMYVPAPPSAEAEIAALTADVAALTAAVAALTTAVAGLAPGGGNGDIQYNAGGTFGGIAGHTSTPTYDLLAADGTTIIQMTFNGGVLTAVTVFP